MVKVVHLHMHVYAQKRIGLSDYISTTTKRMELLLAPNYSERNGEHCKDEIENIYPHKVSPEFTMIIMTKLRLYTIVYISLRGV